MNTTVVGIGFRIYSSIIALQKKQQARLSVSASSYEQIGHSAVLLDLILLDERLDLFG